MMGYAQMAANSLYCLRILTISTVPSRQVSSHGKYATMILDGQEVRTQFRAEHLQEVDGQWFFVTKMRQIKVWNISEKY